MDNQEAQVSSVRPTKKQRQLLDYIEHFIAEHGYSPSYREIMNGCQYTSVATVALHVGNLIKRGHLRKRDHSARSIEVVHGIDNAVVEGVNHKNANLNHKGLWLVEQTRLQLERLEATSASKAEHIADVETLIRACSILKLPTADLEDRLAVVRLQQI